MLIRFLALTRMLQVIDEFEKILFGRLYAGGSMIGNTKKFEGVVGDAPFYIVVLYAVDIHFTVYTFKLIIMNIAGKITGGHFNGNEFRFVVAVFVDGSCEIVISAVLQIVTEKLVTDPVECQDGE